MQYYYLEVEGEEAQIILLLASSIVWHILHNHLHCVYVRMHLSIEVSYFELWLFPLGVWFLLN